MDDTAVTVIIDGSGSMAALDKRFVVQSLCRELQLHNGFYCSFFQWNTTVKPVNPAADHCEFCFEGTPDIHSLELFFQETQMNSCKACILVTDGFIADDTTTLRNLLYKRPDCQFCIIGLGADCDIPRIRVLFPEIPVFSALEAYAALESFIHEK